MSGLIEQQSNGILEMLHHTGAISIGKPFLTKIFLLETHIAGTTHVENIEELNEGLVEGKNLRFFRETDNFYDELAIVVQDEAGNKIGYVPQEHNEILARLMDAGKLIYGVITEKEWVDRWLKITIGIYLEE